MTTQDSRPLPATIEKDTRVAAYIPQTFAEAMSLAEVIHKSGLAPETLRTAGAVFVAMAHGAELGLKPMQAIRLVNVIKGKPTLSADGIVAVILASGVCDYFEPVEESPRAVTWRTRRRGSEEKRATFTIEEAQAAGLVNDMYRKWPKRMLSARCKAFLGRDVYPDIVGGLYTPEEAAEIPTTARPVEPEPEPDPEPPAPTGAPEPRVTQTQLKRLMALRDDLGLSRERDDILRELSVFTRRTITSRNDLTMAEAERYNDSLANLLSHQREQEAAGEAEGGVGR